MNAVIDADTHTNYTRLAHTVGIGEDVFHAISDFGLGNATAHTLGSTQDNLSARSHTIMSDNILCIAEDNKGNIWLGYEMLGVGQLNMEPMPDFSYLVPQEKDNETI